MRFSVALLLSLLFLSLIYGQEDNEEDNGEDYEEDNEEYSSGEKAEEAFDLSSLQSFLNELYAENRTLSTNTSLFEDILFLQGLTRRATEAVVRALFPVLSDYIQTANISSNCFQTILQFFQSLRKQEEWPLRFIDSSARFPFSGLLEGSISDFGEYRECLRLRATTPSQTELKGQYCLTSVTLRLPPKPRKLRFHVPLLNVSGTPLENTLWQTVADNTKLFYIARGLRLGLCVPNTCSPHDLKVLSQGLSSALRLTIKFPEKCETSDDLNTITWTIHQKITLTVFTFLLVLSILACWAPPSRPLLRCFSLAESTRRLFLGDTRSKRLAPIHGIRVISILWILVGHVYLMQYFEVFHVLRHILVDMQRLAWLRYQPLKLGSFLQVDTFLLLGGVTVSFVLLDILASVNRFDWFAFLIFRWLRYTPNVIGLILMYFLLPQLASGPIYQEAIQVITQPCERYWWRNLLYINNFYDATGNCATHTWYLAVDFQLYALSPLIIFALKRSRPLGLTLGLLVILLGALAAISAPLTDPSLEPTLYSLNTLLSDEDIQNNFRLLYWSTLQHISPYFMGVLLGYIVQEHKTLALNRKLEHFLWFFCLSSGVLTIFWSTTFMDSTAAEELPSREWRLLFQALHKITWVLLPSWIILASAFGRPGPIGRFLSLPFWIPLSRLTYSVYLVQLIPIVVRSYSVEYTQPFDDFYNWSLASFCSILAFLLAYILFVLFESPFSGIIKLLTEDQKKKISKL